MKYSVVFTLAAVGSAFVLPSEEVLSNVAIEDNRKSSWYNEVIAAKDNVLSSFKKHFDEKTKSSRLSWPEEFRVSDDDVDETISSIKHAAHLAVERVQEIASDTLTITTNAIDEAISSIEDATQSAAERVQESAFDAQAFLESNTAEFEGFLEDTSEHHSPPDDDHDHDGPPHHGPPGDHHGRRPPPHHKRPHHRPHHGHHGHNRSNATVYQLIANSKYTTKLAFLINQYPDLVKALNSTKANYTIFAPTDKAFAKIPEHAPKPSKEQIEKILSYHVVPDFYPAGRALFTHTVPTLLPSGSLGSEPLPQRLRLHAGLTGLTINFYGRIVALNIFGSNGVIHAIDSLILPPPSAIKIIDSLPAQFSTLELGLGKTGLLEKLNTTKHAGGTLFAPSNNAFARLGPHTNAFLFSQHGLKYLKALLEYHVVPKHTLYSDAYYSADEKKMFNIPRDRLHVDLPTLLEDRSLSIDIARFGLFIDIKINGYDHVAIQDGIAEDGVIHVVSNVIIPPRHVNGRVEFHDGDEIDVEDLKERLAPFVARTDM